ncbi:hypothetical protein C5748_08250 [Phyllobacterium phragmitis]|uniref:Uncharacterized protein n=1 Tax=Phyllobacterium phragmitis TaxID=2670329 RepID=A0A2S9ITI4_9HYPH|nr:hypothetical protein C5748_08250 [Phyllobacterium phragmitis]
MLLFFLAADSRDKPENDDRTRSVAPETMTISALRYGASELSLSIEFDHDQSCCIALMKIHD